MNEPFSTVAKNPHLGGKLVFTTDWLGTLCSRISKVEDKPRFNFELMEFLSDVVHAGHHVLLVSRSPKDYVLPTLERAVTAAKEIDLDISPLLQTRFMEKEMMSYIPDFPVHVAFDDEAIASQQYKYATPQQEIRINSDFTTSPVSLDELRAQYNIPRQSRKSQPSPTALAVSGPEASPV